MDASPKASMDQHEFGITNEPIHMVDSMSKPTTEDAPNRLQRSLKGRQIGMFSIAGAIGTGLLIATGPALAKGGPGSLLLGMIAMGFVCYNVLAAYGEMATAFPMDRGFSGYAARFVDPAYGCVFNIFRTGNQEEMANSFGFIGAPPASTTFSNMLCSWPTISLPQGSSCNTGYLM